MLAKLSFCCALKDPWALDKTHSNVKVCCRENNCFSSFARSFQPLGFQVGCFVVLFQQKCGFFWKQKQWYKAERFSDKFILFLNKVLINFKDYCNLNAYRGLLLHINID